MSLSVLAVQPRRSALDNEEYPNDEITLNISQKYITRHIGYSFKTESKLQRDLINISRQLKECADLKEGFLECFDAWKLSRKKSIKYFDEAIKELDRIHFNTNVAKTTASVGGIVSSFFGIAASVAMLSNKDPSSMRLAADIGNLFSCVVSNGAAATELSLSEAYLDKARQILRNDGKCFEPIHAWYERSQDLKDAIEEVCNYNIISDVIQKLMIVVPLVTCTYDTLVSQVAEMVTEVVKMLHKNIKHSDFEKIVLLCASVCRNPELFKTIGSIYQMVKDSPSVMPVVTMLVKVPCELKFLARYISGSSRKSTARRKESTTKETVTYGLFQGVNVATELFSLKLLVEDFQSGSKSDKSALLKEIKQQLEMELKLVSEERQKLA